MVIISTDLWICMLELFVLKAKGRSWPCCLGQLTETMNFVFTVKHLLQCLSYSHLGLNFLLLPLNAMEKASRDREMTIPSILLLCLWNCSRLIQIKILRAWTYKIIIAYFPLRSMGAYKTCQISAFTPSKDDYTISNLLISIWQEKRSVPNIFIINIVQK